MTIPGEISDDITRFNKNTMLGTSGCGLEPACPVYPEAASRACHCANTGGGGAKKCGAAQICSLEAATEPKVCTNEVCGDELCTEEVDYILESECKRLCICTGEGQGYKKSIEFDESRYWANDNSFSCQAGNFRDLTKKAVKTESTTTTPTTRVICEEKCPTSNTYPTACGPENLPDQETIVQKCKTDNFTKLACERKCCVSNCKSFPEPKGTQVELLSKDKREVTHSFSDKAEMEELFGDGFEFTEISTNKFILKPREQQETMDNMWGPH